MAVSGVNVSSTATTNPWANASFDESTQKSATLNYDSFLKLLIAQMKNQDPTDPMDAGEQMSQLASFSQVEQSIKTNTLLKSSLQAEALTRAGDLIGKTVTSADDKITGVVKSVEIYSDGVIAITEAGEKVLVQVGVVFNDKAATTTTSDSSAAASDESSSDSENDS